MSELPLVTKSQLVHDLHAMGVRPGELLMLHVSVKSLGWVIGGPEMVLQALFDVLMPGGTVMMIASWDSAETAYSLSELPPEHRQTYYQELPAFDSLTSHADWRGMSILAEYLRLWPGAHRSGHPFSYVAVGPLAKTITEKQPLNYRDGVGSPLAKLCQLGGRVLQLGSPLGDITLLHHAETMANVPNKRVVRYAMPLLQRGKRVWVQIEEFDTLRGIVDWPENYFEAIARQYLTSGRGTMGKVGSATARLYNAADLLAFGVEWMEREFGTK
ncbi:MAG: aminoglycoside 3-N-acetyltransferase [Armatimonadetes bacterium]|nr:aminoglycoside 3-N-acetyltransferase [Armatimonadota bacterium]